MEHTSSTLSRRLTVLGLAVAVAAASGCQLFERELNSWEAPDEEEDSGFVVLTGSVRIETRTTGNYPDFDGYSVWHDGGDKQPIGINESLLVGPVHWKPGQNLRWYLGSVAPNCSVRGGTRNPNRPQTWALGRWYLATGGVTDRTVEVVCEV